MYGSNDAMYDGYGAIHISSFARQTSHGEQHAHGEHHGFQANGEHSAFRNVPVACQSDGSFGNHRRVWRTYAHALHACSGGSLDAGKGYRHGGKSACIDKRLQTDVQLGGEYFNHQPRTDSDHDVVDEIICNK